MICFYSLTTKEQTTKFSSAKFQKGVKSKLYRSQNSKARRANCVDLDEMAYYESPHQD